LSTDSTKADEIALEVEREIVTGELPPGAVLRQEHLSEQFRVSRTPVREALRQLAARGLVSFEPNRGVRVRTLSHAELYEAFLIRAELESLATALAAPKLTPADLDELDAAERRFAGLTAKLLQPDDAADRGTLTREWVQANHGFHDVIYRVAEAPMVERLAKSARRTFSGHAVWGTGGSGIDELYEANVRQHQAIIEALRAGSAEAARVLAREHVLASFHLLETVLEQVGTPPAPPGRLRRSA
jgi:DNA-binding GntR family transcriptional regulator